MWRCHKINGLISIFWRAAGDAEGCGRGRGLVFFSSFVIQVRQSCLSARATNSSGSGGVALGHPSRELGLSRKAGAVTEFHPMVNCCHSAEFLRERRVDGDWTVWIFIWETTVMVSCCDLVEQLLLK